jgi:hypothetical protein
LLASDEYAPKNQSGRVLAYELNSISTQSKKSEAHQPSVSIPVSAPGTFPTFLGWHSQLNQILVGTSNGTLEVFYDPHHSKKGILVPLSRAPKQVESDSGVRSTPGYVISPNALPMYKDPAASSVGLGGATKKRTRDEMQPMPAPVAPVTARTFTQYYMQTTGVPSVNLRMQDPVEVLREYEAKVATMQGIKPTPTVLASKTIEMEEEEVNNQLKQYLGK